MADYLDETIPQNSESPTLGAQRIRETRAAFNLIVGIEHDVSDSSTTQGFHGTTVTGKVDTSISDPPSGYGRFGWKTISGKSELFYRNDAGEEKQITSGGQLNIVDADGAVVKTGAQTIDGVKTFNDSPIVPDPTTSTQAANKNYADTGDNVTHDTEGGYNNCDIDGTKTKVYTKYLTGTLDNDSSTNIAHGVADATKILHVSAVLYDGTVYRIAEQFNSASSSIASSITFNSTNIIVAAGANLQAQVYTIKIDYYL